MQVWVTKKIWARVEQHLLEKKHLVFENNSVCVKFDDYNGIYLHPDGLGFVFRNNTYPIKNFEGKVYMPDHIVEIVKGLFDGHQSA
ncbi:MAG: hypothetical protein PHF86_09450 [Candidatus Nanoarchaeia archaeon]|nr:hypothetical protein [Candidatus Nanoarchaeia archaeon]